MAKVRIKRCDCAEQNISLGHGGISIGRDKSCDVYVNDPTVSHQHAKIYTFFDVSYVEDLHSRNGTYVNGKRIEKHTLHHGDVVKIGHCELVYEKTEAAATAIAS